MTGIETEEIDPLPPSTKLVYIVLQEAERALPTTEIADRTRLTERTARYALDRLQDADLVAQRPDPRDPRRNRYAPTPSE